MDEEQSDIIQDSEDKCSPTALKSSDPLLATRKDENLVTSESILSRINEACNKISLAENENGMKVDSELSSDAEKMCNEAENLASNCNGQEEIATNSNKVNNDSFTATNLDNEMELNNDNDKASDMETEENENAAAADAETKVSDTEEEPKVPDTEAEESEIIICTAETLASDLDTEENKAIAETKDSDLEIGENVDATSGAETKDSDMEMEENLNVSSIMETKVSDSEVDETVNPIPAENLENETEENSEPIVDDRKIDDNGGTDSDKNGTGKLKIKLRSFASLCDNDMQSNDNSNSADLYDLNTATDFEVSGVAVGDIVQHSNYVESDECGVMHLKISNVVGGEDCITGLSIDEAGDSLANIQISSITSLIEPISPESRPEKLNASSNTPDLGAAEMTEAESQTVHKFSGGIEGTGLPNQNEISESFKETRMETVVNIFRSPLVVAHLCAVCKKKVVCEFRVVCREKSENRISFVCSIKCKDNAVSKLPENQILQKPRLFFERVCGMCGKDIVTLSKSKILSWQTREFCDKLCLADHIGEVARTCFYCKSNVRVLYMVKYCVRFGSDVHQFCSNTCLETFKTTIKVCSFCQKNLNLVNKVISPSNKEYCSAKCLKRAQRRDIGQINYKEENDCTVCLKNVVNEYEFIYKSAKTFLCSTPCLNVFKYVNQVKSVNCCLCCRLLNAEDTSTFFFNGKQLRVFCSESCFSVFVISARKIVTCHYCKVKKYNFDMIWSLTEDVGEYFCCSVCCLNLVENQNKNSSNQASTPALTDSKDAVRAETGLPSPTDSRTPAVPSDASTPSTPILKNCNMCSKLEPAQFHMVMSDSTLRSFCSYVCATRYKCTFGFQVSGGGPMLESKEEVLKQVTSQTKNSNETQTSKPMVTVPGSKLTSKFDLKDAKTLMRLFCPPHLSNKSTMCRPVQNTKGIQCKPHQWHKSSQTEDDDSKTESKVIIPVPIPVYVPTPMMMYSSATPVPLVVPVPVPIPIFIPTLEKTTKALEDKIKSLLEVKPEIEDKAQSDTVQDEVQNKSLNDSNEELVNESVHTEVKEILKLEHILNKYIISSQEADSDKNEAGSLKRKLDMDSYSVSPKRRKLDDDEADDENEEAEVLNLMFGLSVWQSWVQRKNEEDAEAHHSLQQDLCVMSSDVLGESLIQFLNDLSAQSTQFDADTIFYILLGLQKFLFEKGSAHCIFLEINFDAFTAVFDEMIEKFFQTIAQPCTKLLEGTRVTEEMLWEARQLGAHTPHVLINTLFYFNTKIFKLKSATDHFNLTFGQISKEGKRTSNSPDGSPVLTMYLKYCHDANSEDSDNSNSLAMFENKENPLRCPVKLYEFYLSKCPYSIQNDKETYYVYPEESCLPDSVVWYTMKSIEVSTINKMLNRVLLVKEVQEGLYGL